MYVHVLCHLHVTELVDPVAEDSSPENGQTSLEQAANVTGTIIYVTKAHADVLQAVHLFGKIVCGRMYVVCVCVCMREGLLSI